MIAEYYHFPKDLKFRGRKLDSCLFTTQQVFGLNYCVSDLCCSGAIGDDPPSWSQRRPSLISYCPSLWEVLCDNLCKYEVYRWKRSILFCACQKGSIICSCIKLYMNDKEGRKHRSTVNINMILIYQQAHIRRHKTFRQRHTASLNIAFLHTLD